jgi:hypothetical protein
MSVKTRELYSSPNGDRWLLSHDSDTERVFIRHEANRPSGGQVSELDIGTFLSRGPLNPEHQALLRLIATLVDDGAETPPIGAQDADALSTLTGQRAPLYEGLIAIRLSRSATSIRAPRLRREVTI